MIDLLPLVRVYAQARETVAACHEAFETTRAHGLLSPQYRAAEAALTSAERSEEEAFKALDAAAQAEEAIRKGQGVSRLLSEARRAVVSWNDDRQIVAVTIQGPDGRIEEVIASK